jgi:hypothetical protein
MSAFKKPLPLTIISSENPKPGFSLKAHFEMMESADMKIKLDSQSLPQDFGDDISIVFTVANWKFQFDSAILSELDGGFLRVRKPKVIYKRKLS